LVWFWLGLLYAIGFKTVFWDSPIPKFQVFQKM
jgi:hypothetical protein